MKSICLNCLCETTTTAHGKCNMCGQDKPSNSTIEQLRTVLKSRILLAGRRKSKIEERYDLGVADADKYASTIRTAADIPNERGPI